MIFDNLDQFKYEIYNKFKDKYEQITYEQVYKETFDKFYETVLSELKIAYNKSLSKNALLVKLIRPMKKRWIKIVIHDINSSFNKDIESAQIQYDKVKCGEMTISKFESFFGVSDIDNYKKLQLKTLNKWAMDDKLFLTDFKYLNCLINRSIMIALKNDIYLFYFLCVEKEKVKITKVPTILSELPIDITNKFDYLSDAQKSNLDQASDIDTLPPLEKLISLEGDEQDEILIRLEKKTYLEIKKGGNPDKFKDMMTQIALLKSIKYLNSNDTRIINYYYNHFLNVLTGTPIDKTICDITIELGWPNRTQYYDQVENSLAKIGSINMTYNIEGNRLFGNLLSCMLYTTDNGVKRAEVYLGPILQKIAIKDSAFEYDKSVYNNLSSASQQLAVWVQKRRYNLAINKDGNIDGITTKTFSNAIYFNTKRADRRRNKIIESLEELKSVELIIKSYNYNKRLDMIEIEYIELTAKERNKLGLLDENLVEVECIEKNNVVKHIE